MKSMHNYKGLWVNNSIPYTGLTSKKAKTIAEGRQKSIQKKQESRMAILPAYEQIIADLTAEIDRMNDISSYTSGGYVTDDETRFELSARSRYVALCKALRGKYTITVKGAKHE